MAMSGHNGNNETLIGVSNSIGLSIYDLNNNEIPITNSQIEILIQRDTNLPEVTFVYVNASQIQLSSEAFYLPNAFNLSSANASIHIELFPLNETVGYLMVLKFGSMPMLNTTYSSYDAFELFCPSKFLIF